MAGRLRNEATHKSDAEMGRTYYDVGHLHPLRGDGALRPFAPAHPDQHEVPLYSGGEIALECALDNHARDTYIYRVSIKETPNAST